MKADIVKHYDLLIEENNDPVYDSPELKAYMNKYDGETFKRALLPLSGKSVLEIGVGTGRLAKLYAPICSDFTGIDLSPKTIKRAKENLGKIKANLICADFFEYEFNKKFDVVYSSLTFMHFKDKQKAISKGCMLVNDGGKIVISITKSQDKILDYGTRQIEIYPDNKEIICQYLKEEVFSVSIMETELAYVLVAKRQNK